MLWRTGKTQKVIIRHNQSYTNPNETFQEFDQYLLVLKIRLYLVAPRIKLKALKRSFIQKVFLLII